MNIIKIKEHHLIQSSMHSFKNIHMIGIGGAGMCGIAIILLELGYNVSGSDLLKNNMTEKLIKKGARIYFYHAAKNVQTCDLIVISSAIALDNIEMITAKKKRIPIFLRAEMLQQLMQNKLGITITGTHGKTTTTSMIVDMYRNAGMDPNFINGGLIKSVNTFAQLGSSNDFIVEADESDASFLFLHPDISIVTNIDADHLDHYDRNFDKLKKTFLQFINGIPNRGIVIICIDNKILHDMLPKIKCHIITYGFHRHADIRIVDYQQDNFIGKFLLIRKNKSDLNVTLNIPGKHNSLNAAAAVALATQQGIQDIHIVQSLKTFQGTRRRFEFLGMVKLSKKINAQMSMLIDDYGHHPNELSENIQTIRNGWPDKKLFMIFQPHRYTRTQNLYSDFIHVLSQVDELILLDVYAAHEPVILGADSYSLCLDINKLNKKSTLVSSYKLVRHVLIPKLNGNDIILIQGAGNIEVIAKNLIDYATKKTI